MASHVVAGRYLPFEVFADVRDFLLRIKSISTVLV